MDLPVQSSKIFIRVEFACVHSGEYICVVNVCVVPCNNRKKLNRKKSN